jgi:hypothetical protein
MPDQPRKPTREKRRVSLEGEDPIEVLKRLLGRPPEPRPPKEKEKSGQSDG